MAGMAKTLLQPYKPDDAAITVADLEFLHGDGTALLKEAQALAAAGQTDSLQAIGKLRKQYESRAVHAALTLAKCSARALGPKGKFHGVGDFFWAVPEALEQASSLAVARHKAQRFATMPGRRGIVDLCCGIGGDALGLAIVAPVTGVEQSPVRAWLAAQNAAATPQAHAIQIVQGDVTRLPVPALPGLAFHIDPARRSAGKRKHAYADMVPGPAVLDRLLKEFSAGAIKLSPGVDTESLPEGHLEFISEHGVNVQAVLWTGALADQLGCGQRTASVLAKDGSVATISGRPEPVAALVEPRAYVFEIDSAVHHGGLAPALARELDCAPINADGGLVTSDESLADPCVVRFAVHTSFAYSEKAVAAQLPGPCLVEVKPRGLDLDTDRLQRLWSKAGTPVLSLLIYRGNSGLRACLARRADAARAGA